MNNYRIEPITTVEQLDAALNAGARIEFTVCGDGYELPLSDEPMSAGWVLAHKDAPDLIEIDREDLRKGLYCNDGRRLRAIYPTKLQEAA